eukprot:Gb_15688 [translate_table: standard]
MASQRIWGRWVFRIVLFVLVAVARSDPFSTRDTSRFSTVEVISDIKDSIVEKLGWKADEVKISNIDSLDTMFGHAVLYEFDIQVENKIFPLRLAGDVNSWQFMEDILPTEDNSEVGEIENSLTKHRVRSEALAPVLAPFPLAGPVELWIQDADNMRLSVPHDVEAGVLKKVMLADGAVVTVKGAREVSLRQPLQLPLPLSSGPGSSLASRLVALGAKLRQSSSMEERPLSLRIVGPNSLVASSVSEPDSTSNKLRVKRLAPGSVELVSRQPQPNQEASTPVSVEAASNTLSPNDMWMWPIPSVNGSDPRLKGFEKLLEAILGPEAQKKGSFKLLKARAAAAKFIKVQFEIEKKLDDAMFDSWPEWRTKPSVTRLQFELTAKVEGDKILPVNVQQIEPLVVAETFSSSLKGNISMSKTDIWYPPSSPLTL